MPRAYPVQYRVEISMPYQPGSWECEVTAYSTMTAAALAGMKAERDSIPLTADIRITVTRKE